MNYLKNKHFGDFGGRYVPEMLIPALDQLEKVYFEAKKDKEFKKEFKKILKDYVGRPSPLYYAENLTKHFGGAKIYLKNEGLNQTGAHKINNAVGQALLCQRMKKKSLVAETGAGQHGVASSSIAAKFGFDCKVFMGSVDIVRQYPNVYSMKLLGADVVSVEDGTKTLKDAVNAALKYWIENLKESHYLIGSALGPYPYPLIVRDFQSVIGEEIKSQILKEEGKLPSALIACVGGGSNSMGMFYPFIKEKKVRLIGVEAGGRSNKIGDHATRIANQESSIGIVQGYKSFFIQNKEGQLQQTHSISAGLDYAGIGPELAYLASQKRVEFMNVLDDEVLLGFKTLIQKEGIFPALESAHAIAALQKIAPQMSKKSILVANVSGRGDKDIFITAREIDKKGWREFLKEELKR